MIPNKPQALALAPNLKLIIFSIAWGLAMMASALIKLYWVQQVLDSKSILLILFIGIGASIAFPIATLALRFTPSHWLTGQKFAFAFLGLSLLTIGLTAFIFALHFRAYFAQWHDDAFSLRLVLETIFTILSGVYQFLVLGLRLYLPLGLMALLGASWALATKRI